MKAVRLHHYGEYPVVEEVAEPKITGPHDVIVRIGGSGVDQLSATWRLGRRSSSTRRAPAASAPSAVRAMICTAPPQPFPVSRLMVAWPPF